MVAVVGLEAGAVVLAGGVGPMLAGTVVNLVGGAK
jgi:hypothetical protein